MKFGEASLIVFVASAWHQVAASNTSSYNLGEITSGGIIQALLGLAPDPV